MEEYVGKPCNKCGKMLYENDEVIICPACGKPHHVNCWIADQGCATDGCTEQNPLIKKQNEINQLLQEQRQEIENLKRKNKRKTTTVICIVLALLVIGGIVAFRDQLPFGGSGGQQNQSTSNKNNSTVISADNAKQYFKVELLIEGGKAAYKRDSQFHYETYKGEGYLVAEVSALKGGSYENCVVQVELHLNSGGGDGEFYDGYNWKFASGGTQRVWENGKKDACFIKTVSVRLDQFGKGSVREKVQINASRPTYALRSGMSEDLDSIYNDAYIVGGSGTVIHN